LVIGTRGSALAIAQATRIADLLAASIPGFRSELRIVRTEGDDDKTSPLTVIGGRGVFTSGLQTALVAGDIDVAVHSAKDLPALEPDGLVLAAFPEREDPRDVVVSRHGVGLRGLPSRPRIGTSSRRRAMQVSLARPDATIVELRGNVDTRLKKATTEEYDAIVLAAAGLCRVGLIGRVTEYLSLHQFVPAPGQGALAVEVRATDADAMAVVAAIDAPDVSTPVRAERAFLRALGAGCTTPLGVHVRRDGGHWRLIAVHGSAEGGSYPAWRVDRKLVSEDPESEAGEIALEMMATTTRARSGRRVLVTRASAQAEPLVQALKAVGADPVAFPTIRIAPAADPTLLDAALARLAEGDYSWIAFSSANAVQHVAARLQATGRGADSLACAKVAAVGRATAEALTERGIVVALVASEQSGAGLGAAMTAAGVNGHRVLYPRGDLARDALVRALAAAGAIVDDVEAYRTLPEPDVDPYARRLAERGDVDVVTFASPSSVRNLAAALGGDLSPLARARIVCVGPTTARTAVEYGLPAHAVADDASARGLAAAAVEALDELERHRQFASPAPSREQGDST
jgi:hydroxymethylbilane synthase